MLLFYWIFFVNIKDVHQSKHVAGDYSVDYSRVLEDTVVVVLEYSCRSMSFSYNTCPTIHTFLKYKAQGRDTG